MYCVCIHKDVWFILSFWFCQSMASICRFETWRWRSRWSYIPVGLDCEIKVAGFTNSSLTIYQDKSLRKRINLPLILLRWIYRSHEKLETLVYLAYSTWFDIIALSTLANYPLKPRSNQALLISFIWGLESYRENARTFAEVNGLLSLLCLVD